MLRDLADARCLRSAWRLAGCLTFFLGATPTPAAVHEVSEGALRTICLDVGTKKHPRTAELSVPIPDDRFERAGAVTLTLIYEPDPSNSGSKGKVTTSLIRIGANDETTDFGKVSARQSAAAAPLVAAVRVVEPLAAGDTVVWKLRFKKFDKLRDEECFTLFALVTPSE